MTKYWIVVFGILAPVGVHAGSLDDFSNNLATDLGPLLVLFGEAMTKQYLSECTSFLDYLIFALAPIGILTAMTSAIRVCGYPALRAFIGRAQEGQGAVEAELCTSTSRDVCELYNRGGITRVLGRPYILELVYILGGKDNRSTAGLHLFNDYLQSDQHNQLWNRVNPSKSRQTAPDDDRNDNNGFAPHPNISLNAGIVKRPDWVFGVVAVTGILLQGGLIALATVGAWKLDWTVKDTENPSSSNYAPIMYVAGTVIMAVGICGCAAVIGQSTDEIEYRRVPVQPKERHEPLVRRFWLQPGPQDIGEQFFDPFAHAEDTRKPLLVWISSTKNFDDKFQRQCIIAVLATLIGYIMQFIGLRGMRAWLSIAQLAVCVVMSMARGALRAQRVSHSDNLLGAMPDLVAGHELDWMTFKILENKTPVWHITGKYEKAIVGAADSDTSKQSAISSNLDTISGGELNFFPPTNDNPGTCSRPSSPLGIKESLNHAMPTTHQVANKARASCEDFLRIRVRLAQLTGHLPLGRADDGHQKWKDEFVKVRSKAIKVSAAICQVAEKLFTEQIPKNDVTLRIIGTTAPNTTKKNEVIEITLRPPPDETLGGWQIDSARVEAILGLSMWSLISSGHKSGDIPSHTETVPTMGIISVARMGHEFSDKQQEMDLWLGSRNVMLKEATLELNLAASHGIFDLWENPKLVIRNRQPPTFGQTGQGVSRENAGSGNENVSILASGNEAVANEGEDQPRRRLSNAGTESIGATRAFGNGTRRRGNIEDLGEARGNIWTLASSDTSKQTYPGKRLCGWNAVYEALDSDLTPTTSSEGDRYRIQTFECTGSLLDICCRELFSALAASLTSLSHVVAPTFDTKDGSGNILLESETVTILTTACTDNALGSHSEAVLSVITALGKQLQTPNDEEMLSTIIAKADTYRRDNEWQRAENLLRWACDYYSSAHGQYGLPTGTRSRLFEKALLTTGEFYLWAYREIFTAKMKGFAGLGIDWMHRKFERPIRDRSGTTDILQRYREVQTHMVLVCSSSNEELRAELRMKMEEQNRAQTLYYLCRIRDFRLHPFEPAFTLAVRHGWTEAVAAMLEMGASIDSYDSLGRTAVSYCAELGYDLKPYIDGGADVNEGASTGEMPLHIAVRRGNEEAVKLLIRAGASVRARTNNEDDAETPLHYVARYGHAAMVAPLLESGARVHDKTISGFKPLHIAAQYGSVEVARKLIANGAFVLEPTPGSNTVLHLAAEHGQEAMVKFLIDEQADVHARDAHRLTPLFPAAKYGHEAVTRLLLENGANVHARTRLDNTSLHWTGQYGHEAVARLLIEQGHADLNAKNKDGFTSLHYAARNGHESMVKLFVQEHADVQARNNDGYTALHYAARYGHEAIVKHLLDNGAKVGDRNTYGYTPLHYAARVSHEAVQELRQDGALKMIIDAVKASYEATQKLLKNAGADMHEKANNGNTPEQLAKGLGSGTGSSTDLDKETDLGGWKK